MILSGLSLDRVPGELQPARCDSDTVLTGATSHCGGYSDGGVTGSW
jgi:hypothetical protein